MKTKLFSILTLAGLFLFIFPTVMTAQYNWDDASDNPVLNWGQPEEWDDGQVWNPAVIKDGDTLRMYYTGGNEIVWEDAMTKIGYAWSLDGIEWNRYPSNPVLLPKFGNQLFGCAVIKDDSIYKMWYGESTSGVNDLPFRVGYATSEDGINWTKKTSMVLKPGSSNEWDESGITPQTVIKTGEKYRMYYWGCRPGFPYEESYPQIGMAESQDGITWTKHNDPSTTDAPFAESDPVLDLGSQGTWDADRVIDPMVVKLHNGYHMFYSGLTWTSVNQSIGYATSSNGINWTKHPDPVYSAPSWGNTTYGGTVLAFNNEFHLWYALFHSNGNENQARPQVGYAIAQNPESVHESKNIVGFSTHPNPFSYSTKINFELLNPEYVQIEIYNHLGKLIEVFDRGNSKGKQQLVWNAEGLPACMYFCVIKTESGIQSMKMVKLK